MGHEGAGVVVETGGGVAGVALGDPVVLNWAMPCGACLMCRTGHTNICERKPAVPDQRTLWRGTPVGKSFNLGTLARFTVVPVQAVTRITVPMPFESACLMGCGVMTGVGSVLNVAGVRPGESVVVLGAGGVGLNIIQGARIAGADPVIAVDVSENRLALATRFGATHAIAAERDDEGLERAAERVREMLGGRGADYCFESTAVPSLAAAPLAMIRNAGMAVQASGVEQVVPVNMRLFEWDKLYINPKYGQCDPPRDFPRLMQLYADGALLLDELVTRIYRIGDLPLAFEDMLSGQNAKGVIVFGDS
jgi:S-(hydroxymethyl)glutathione dehydrogenase/alcohol dehydrogenase